MGDGMTFSTVKGGVEKGGEVEAPDTLHHHPFIGVVGGGGGAREAGSRVEVETPSQPEGETPSGPSRTIPTRDQWGPFAPDIDQGERRARLRGLRAVVHLTTGPRGDEAARLLHFAERDPNALPDAASAINALAPLDRRHVWASYASLSRPPEDRRCSLPNP